jgi:uncharacterized protein (DUF924 family)
MTPDDVLSFWIGPLDASGRADAFHTKRWFTRDPALDEEIRIRFAELHRELANGEHADWRTTDRGLLAAIVVLDQFSRNMFRGTAKAFAADALAVELARRAVAAGVDRRLRYDERGFVYMPFMHCEHRATQDECVALFENWCAELSPALADGAFNGLRYAGMHREIVARFGRFPHRNAVLGRESTADEKAFVLDKGSMFGQG